MVKANLVPLVTCWTWCLFSMPDVKNDTRPLRGWIVLWEIYFYLPFQQLFFQYYPFKTQKKAIISKFTYSIYHRQRRTARLQNLLRSRWDIAVMYSGILDTLSENQWEFENNYNYCCNKIPYLVFKYLKCHLTFTLSTCRCQYSSCTVRAGLASIREKKVGCVRNKLSRCNPKCSATAACTFSFTLLKSCVRIIVFPILCYLIFVF